jgi:Growth inhibitor
VGLPRSRPGRRDGQDPAGCHRSLDALNQRLQTVTICPLTTQLHPAWRTRLGCRVGGRDVEVAVDQIRTISKARLGKKLGSLSSEEARALRRVITEMYGE